MDTTLVDIVAWAKTCFLIAAATTPGTPERAIEIERTREATACARAAVDASTSAVPPAVLVDLRVCELGLPKIEAGAVLRR